MLLDANILLYVIDRNSPFHDAAQSWLGSVVNGTERIALPWQTIGAFLRLSTHPRISESPLSSSQADSFVAGLLARDTVWIPPTTEATYRVFSRINSQLSISGNLVPDALLGALAIEHGLEVITADGDFARLPGVRWRNPLA